MSNRIKFWQDRLYWLGKELLGIYTTKSSFFSKKRLESSIAFIIGQWGMIFWLMENHATASVSDIAIWAGIEFAISGYILTEIQKEKKSNEESSGSSSPE
jgi:hypothetical protein